MIFAYSSAKLGVTSQKRQKEYDKICIISIYFNKST